MVDDGVELWFEFNIDDCNNIKNFLQIIKLDFSLLHVIKANLSLIKENSVSLA